MGLCRLGANMTEKVNENISVRMGQEDISKMDEFLAEHPELGGRSQFIRTAVSHYINRDADVEDRKGDGFYIRFTPKEAETMEILISRGEYLSKEEFVRSVIRSYMHEPAKAQERAREIMEGVTSSSMQE